MMSITRPLTQLTPPHHPLLYLTNLRVLGGDYEAKKYEVEVNPAGNLIFCSFSELPYCSYYILGSRPAPPPCRH